MSTPENEAGAAPAPATTSASDPDAKPIGDEVEHTHDIADSDLPEDLQPDENPLAAGPGDDDEASAFDPPGKLDGGKPADSDPGPQEDPADGEDADS